MTQKQLDALNAARSMYRDFTDYAHLHRQRLCDALMDHTDRCDRRYPDGSDARIGGL